MRAERVSTLRMEDDLDRQIDETLGRGKRYTLLLLWKGPNWTADGDPDGVLQHGHLRHLFSLRNNGSLLLNGPIVDGGDLIGLGIFDDPDLAAVKALAEDDPSVQAGRLRADVRPWFGIAGDTI